jgi:hypothetical protein
MTVIAIYCTRRSIVRDFVNFDFRTGSETIAATQAEKMVRNSGGGGGGNKLGLPNRVRLEHQLVLTRSVKSAPKKNLDYKYELRLANVRI